jgi:hypothetical protein
VPRRVFGYTGDKLRSVWGKLRKETFHESCFSPDIVEEIKPRRIKMAGRVTPYKT